MVAQQDTTIVGENANKTMLMMMIKGKRSIRSRLSSPSSLTMSTTDEAASSVSDVWTPAAASEEEQDMARCLILLAQGTPTPKNNNNNNNNNNGMMSYECKTCNRTFPSFQALGGHRTSHKKPKLTDVMTTESKKPSLTFSIVSDGSNNQIDQSNEDDGLSLMLQMGSTSVTTNKGKVHECSICGAEFSSGQALGGHMRRHRPIASALKMAVTTEQAAIPNSGFSLDLNLPAPEEDYSSSKFVFPSNDKTLVFTASSLVDCHY
ncbi:zinc finger protein ZAT5-like [Silene latifolia]|uniref:zinc finger protein ZAT5-like n=1 Tax=Silene latifolia TaxID=37657 RepID=UPI003D7834FA